MRSIVCMLGIALAFASSTLTAEEVREIKIVLKAEGERNPADINPDEGKPGGSKLHEVLLDGRTIGSAADGKPSTMQTLHDKIVEIVLTADGTRRPGDYKVVLEVDNRLSYEPVAAVIEAFSVHRHQPNTLPQPLVSYFSLLVGRPDGNSRADIKLFTSKAPSPPDAVPEEPVVLQMNEAGEIYYGGFDFAKLSSFKKRLSVKRTVIIRTGLQPKDTVVIVRPDKNCPARYVREVFEVCRELKFDTFAFRTAAPND